MIGRLIAWSILALVVFGAYQGVKHFKNPWATPAVAAAATVGGEFKPCVESCK